jgi:hypothetical protein
MQQRNEGSTRIHRPAWFIAGLIALMITDFLAQLLQIRMGQAQPMPSLWVVGTLVTLFCLVRSAQSTPCHATPAPIKARRHE